MNAAKLEQLIKEFEMVEVEEVIDSLIEMGDAYALEAIEGGFLRDDAAGVLWHKSQMKSLLRLMDEVM